MKVTIYSTKTCVYCKMLKDWLDNNSIEYTNYNVEDNPFAAQMMMIQSGQRGVPFSTIEYDDGSIEKILGFYRPRFEALLGSSASNSSSEN